MLIFLAPACDSTDLKNAVEAKNNDYGCYIIAKLSSREMPSSGLLFTIGDSKYYGGYYNEPLTSGNRYMLHVVAEIPREVIE